MTIEIDEAAVARMIRTAAGQVRAPESLRSAVEQQRAGDRHGQSGRRPIPPRRAAGSTCMNAARRTPWPSQRALPAHRAGRWWLAARALGALATLAVGTVHLQQYTETYSSVPTIGTLFVLNFAGATVIGLGLLAPTERLTGRFGGALVALLTAGGVVLSATAFVFLLIAEHRPLFGFMEPGYDPTAIAASRVSEAAAVALLLPFLVARFVARVPMPRW